jgi:LPXTG-motif cell wall-anchored protein
MRRLLPTASIAAALVIVGAAAPASALTAGSATAETAVVDASSVTRALTVGAGGPITTVAVELDFQHVRNTCSAPEAGGVNGVYYQDLAYTLTSPEGTTVQLIAASASPVATAGASYATVGGSTQPPVAVRLVTGVDAPVVGSTNGGVPESGTFQAAQSLDALIGQDPEGTWTLGISDAFAESQHCFLGAELVLGFAPTLASGDLPRGIVGTAYSASLPATDSSSATYEVVDAGALPTGVTVAADGSITGTPTSAGTFAFDVVARDADGASTAVPFTIVVDAAASLAGPPAADARIGEPFTYAPTFDAGSPAATVSGAGLPAWLTLDPATGVLTGTPSAPLGDAVVTLTASNGVEPSSTLVVTISVAAGDLDAIVLTPEAQTVVTGGSIDFVVAGEDVEGNPIDVSGSVTLTSDAEGDVIEGLSVRFGAPGTRTITATHANGETDTSTVTVAAAPAPSAPAPSAPAPSAPAPSAPAPSAPAAAAPASGLPQTGADLASAGLVVLAATLMLGAGALVLTRRRTQQR